MHKMDVIRHQILHTIAENCVGVAAAKFHQVILAARVGLGGNFSRQLFCDVFIAKFIHIFHSVASVSVAKWASISAINFSVFSASSGLMVLSA